MSAFTKQFALLRETAAMAFDTLRSNKMRSALTVLGVVIGVTSIVGMTSLIRGFDSRCATRSTRSGPNTIFVQKFGGLSFASGASFMQLMRRPNLTADDMQRDRARCRRRSAWSTSGSAAAAGTPQHAARVLPAASGRGRCRSSARPSATSTINFAKMDAGRSFTEQEVAARAPGGR